MKKPRILPFQWLEAIGAGQASQRQSLKRKIGPDAPVAKRFDRT